MCLNMSKCTIKGKVRNMFENIISGNFIIKSITRSLIIFKKPRKMTNDFFNHYTFVRTFQWTSSEYLTNVTIMVKVAMVTYIHCEKG